MKYIGLWNYFARLQKTPGQLALLFEVRWNGSCCHPFESLCVFTDRGLNKQIGNSGFIFSSIFYIVVGKLVSTYVPVFHSYFSLLSLSYKWVGAGEGEGRSLKYSQDLLFTVMDF